MLAGLAWAAGLLEDRGSGVPCPSQARAEIMPPAECRGEGRVAWRLLLYYHHIYDLRCSHRSDCYRQAKLRSMGHHGATTRDSCLNRRIASSCGGVAPPFLCAVLSCPVLLARWSVFVFSSLSSTSTPMFFAWCLCGPLTLVCLVKSEGGSPP
jgi:hypothetical protein